MSGPRTRRAPAVDPGAFDSAADWQYYSVGSHTGELPRGAVRVNCGLSDPFLPASQDLENLLQPPDSVVLTPGGHDATFWAGNGPAQIRFIRDHLMTDSSLSHHKARRPLGLTIAASVRN